jgi:hypothetical protein
MVTIIERPRDADLWKKAGDAKYFGKGKAFTREDWDHLLGDKRVREPALWPRKELQENYLHGN